MTRQSESRCHGCPAAPLAAPRPEADRGFVLEVRRQTNDQAHRTAGLTTCHRPPPPMEKPPPRLGRRDRALTITSRSIHALMPWVLI